MLFRCSNLGLSCITLRRVGHFTALLNGCDGAHSDGLHIDTASDQDGWNILNTQNVTITKVTIASIPRRNGACITTRWLGSPIQRCGRSMNASSFLS